MSKYLSPKTNKNTYHTIDSFSFTDDFKLNTFNEENLTIIPLLTDISLNENSNKYILSVEVASVSESRLLPDIFYINNKAIYVNKKDGFAILEPKEIPFNIPRRDINIKGLNIPLKIYNLTNVGSNYLLDEPVSGETILYSCENMKKCIMVEIINGVVTSDQNLNDFLGNVVLDFDRILIQVIIKYGI